MLDPFRELFPFDTIVCHKWRMVHFKLCMCNDIKQTNKSHAVSGKSGIVTCKHTDSVAVCIVPEYQVPIGLVGTCATREKEPSSTTWLPQDSFMPQVSRKGGVGDGSQCGVHLCSNRSLFSDQEQFDRESRKGSSRVR